MACIASVLALAIAGLACGTPTPQPDPPPSNARSERAGGDSDTDSEERARRLAEEKAVEAGYDLARYELSEPPQLQAGLWWFHYRVPPPAPPGATFSVSVDQATEHTELMRGE